MVVDEHDVDGGVHKLCNECGDEECSRPFGSKVLVVVVVYTTSASVVRVRALQYVYSPVSARFRSIRAHVTAVVTRSLYPPLPHS